MIEPGKNGRRSGSVAKGRCEAARFAKNRRPLARWILTAASGRLGLNDGLEGVAPGGGDQSTWRVVADRPTQPSCGTSAGRCRAGGWWPPLGAQLAAANH